MHGISSMCLMANFLWAFDDKIDHVVAVAVAAAASSTNNTVVAADMPLQSQTSRPKLAALLKVQSSQVVVQPAVSCTPGVEWPQAATVCTAISAPIL